MRTDASMSYSYQNLDVVRSPLQVNVKTADRRTTYGSDIAEGRAILNVGLAVIVPVLTGGPERDESIVESFRNGRPLFETFEFMAG